jgi:peptidoglycan-N-acetylglucosamine deacetylase
MRFNNNKIIKNVLNVAMRSVAGIITHVYTENPIASLTFDDGPDPIYTQMVLDILKKFDAHATFFMVGQGAHSHPDIITRVASDGHAIGNHSWDHSSFRIIPSIDRWQQIRRCQKVIRPYGERLFRPPYGLNGKMSNLELSLHGYKVIGWNLSSEDWYESNSEVMVDSLLNNIKFGSIILFHDRLFDGGKPKMGSKLSQEPIIDRGPMLLALRELLERMRGKIQFVTIPVLLRSGRPHREAL